MNMKSKLRILAIIIVYAYSAYLRHHYSLDFNLYKTFIIPPYFIDKIYSQKEY